jgi:hypothetical protein
MNTATFEESNKTEASEFDTELSALSDDATEFLSEEELSYYLSLQEL